MKKDVRNLRRVCDDDGFLRVMQDVSGGKTCLYFKREIFGAKYDVKGSESQMMLDLIPVKLKCGGLHVIFHA